VVALICNAQVELNGDARDELAGGKVIGFISSFIGVIWESLDGCRQYDGNR
jgi:hypothetical protein